MKSNIVVGAFFDFKESGDKWGVSRAPGTISDEKCWLDLPSELDEVRTAVCMFIKFACGGGVWRPIILIREFNELD